LFGVVVVVVIIMYPYTGLAGLVLVYNIQH